jgi:hypothetical protein
MYVKSKILTDIPMMVTVNVSLLPCKCPGGNRWRWVTPAGTTAGLEAAGGKVFWKLTAAPLSGETILPATTGLVIAGCEVRTHSQQALNWNHIV